MTLLKKKKLRPSFKIHGGKYYLSNWIIEHFPKNYEEMDYVEPFAGAISVLLNKDKSPLEAINDLNLGIVQILRALRDEPEDFIGKLRRKRYTDRVFNSALRRKNGPFEDYIDHAVNEFVLRRMSRGGLKKAFAWSNRERGGQPGDVNAWKTIIKELPLIAKRMKDVHIFNKPAVEVIKPFSEENVLCYCDPPYVPNTRTSPNVYDMEMTIEAHIELAEALNQHRGKVILSGYLDPLYKRLYANWRYARKRMPNHSSQSKKKKPRTEYLWMNF